MNLPKRISPFYKDVKRIPRKTKKKVKAWCWVHYDGLTNEERLWDYLECKNKAYKQFLINNV